MSQQTSGQILLSPAWVKTPFSDASQKRYRPRRFAEASLIKTVSFAMLDSVKSI